MQDKDIIDTADRWRDQEHQREQYDLERKHRRRDKIVDTLTGEGFLAAAFIVFTVLALAALITHAGCPVEEIDCAGADKQQLEKLILNCEKLDAFDRRHSCVSGVHETFCQVRKTRTNNP